MRYRLRALYPTVAMFIAVAAFALPAKAQSEDAILAVLTEWSEIYATATDAAEMQALYHPDAVFFGTGGIEPMIGAAAFGPYFQNQFDNFTDRQHALLWRGCSDRDGALSLQRHAARRRRADRGALPLHLRPRPYRRRLAHHPAPFLADPAMILVSE